MSIHIEHLNYIYDNSSAFPVAALKDVSVNIPDGEFVCIIGHTGSGKSTFVQHLNGLLKPSSVAKMLIENIDLTQKKPDYALLRKRVGMVFQYPEYQLFEQTVFADIAYGPENAGFCEKEVEQLVKESMRLVGLDESFEELSPFELSGGQKRRVAIAGVLAMKPKVLVLDEPASGLDPMGRKELFSLIKCYKEENSATIIMISHNMDDVAKLADRVIVLDNGTVAMNGTPSEVFMHSYELEQMGLEVPTVSKLVREISLLGKEIPTNIYLEEQLVAFLKEAKK